MNQRTLEPSEAEQTALANGIKWVNRTPYIAAGILFVLISAYGFAFVKNGWSESPEAWGQLGDYIGGLLNPLVAGFALMAVVVSVRLQKAELAETRRELENSRLAMQEQAKTTEQQRCEQRFFDFLTIYQITLQTINFEEKEAIIDTIHNILRSEQVKHPPATRSGKQAFLFLTSSFRSPIKSLLPLFQLEKSQDNKEDEILEPEEIIKTWEKQSPLLDHYFRTVFTLLREAEPILKGDHYRYVKLFRAQLSRDEINILALNLLYDDRSKKMHDLVTRYGMLKHMPNNHLRKIAEEKLDAKSFGNKWAEITISTFSEETPC